MESIGVVQNIKEKKNIFLSARLTGLHVTKEEKKGRSRFERRRKRGRGELKRTLTKCKTGILSVLFQVNHGSYLSAVHNAISYQLLPPLSRWQACVLTGQTAGNPENDGLGGKPCSDLWQSKWTWTSVLRNVRAVRLHAYGNAPHFDLMHGF